MTRGQDQDEHLAAIGGIPVEEAPEPLEHMTETYYPDPEDGDDGPTHDQSA